MSEIGIFLIGFIVAFIPKWLDRKRKIRSHWRAIKGEIALINEKAQAYLDHKIMAPLYRLPHKAYDTSFSMLLTEGVIEPNELISFERFYDLVKDINRGLDQIQGFRVQGNEELMDREYTRNVLKVQELVQGSKGVEALNVYVGEILEFKCNLKLVHY